MAIAPDHDTPKPSLLKISGSETNYSMISSRNPTTEALERRSRVRLASNMNASKRRKLDYTKIKRSQSYSSCSFTSSPSESILCMKDQLPELPDLTEKHDDFLCSFPDLSFSLQIQPCPITPSHSIAGVPSTPCTTTTSCATALSTSPTKHFGHNDDYRHGHRPHRGLVRSRTIRSPDYPFASKMSVLNSSLSSLYYECTDNEDINLDHDKE